MDDKNIEINFALQTIELLKQYKTAKNQTEKDNILKQIDDIYVSASGLLTVFSPDELITKITKAISLDKYRPRNMSILQLAISRDLNYVGGDFDTFNSILSQMFKTKADTAKIRDKFKAGTVNVYMLAKQFSADWIRRLNNHKDLVDAARNASEENIVDAYNELFNALTNDFCKEYDCHIDSKVVTDWATSDVKPSSDYDSTLGIHNVKVVNSTVITRNMSNIEKLLDEFLNNSKKSELSVVRVNITNVNKCYPDKKDFFYGMIGVLAHETHHALDYQKPRQGALGPQIKHIDRVVSGSASKDLRVYNESATEISSHEIERELFNQLKKSRY